MNIIVAMTRDRVIGNGNSIPWNIPQEMHLFKRLTTGCTVVMGRSTYESIGRPLPNRTNIVISTTMEPVDGIKVVSSFGTAISPYTIPLGQKIWVIGGHRVYEEALRCADFLYISWINKSYEGDTYFPEFDLDQWEQIFSDDSIPEFEYCVYKRKWRQY